MQLSVIIPTKQRDDALAACLKRLSPQLRAADEIIVVDNASSDSTERLVSSFKASCRITYLADPYPGASHARNSGFLRSTNEGIAFIDDDSMVTHGWARAVRSILQSRRRMGADAVFQGDMIQKYKREDAFEHIRSREFLGDMTELGMYTKTSRITPVASLIVANIFGLRRTFLRVEGPFDAVRFPFIGEDFDLSMRLLKQGVKLLHAPHAAVVHAKAAMTLRGACRAAYLYGRAQAIHEMLYSGDPGLIVQTHMVATHLKRRRQRVADHYHAGSSATAISGIWYRLWTLLYYQAGYLRYRMFRIF